MRQPNAFQGPALAPPVLQQVERRHGVTPEEFQSEYLAKRRPVILTDVCVWKDALPLDLKALKRAYGDLRLEKLQHAEGGYHQLTPQQLEKTPTLGDFLDRFALNDPDLPYLVNLSIPLNFPTLMPALGAEAYLSPNWLKKPLLRNTFNSRGLADGEMFFGPAGSGYPHLHFDIWCLHVLSAQLYGKKRWWLFPPEEARCLYPKPEPNGWYPHHSSVNMEKPDLQLHPLFAQVKGYTAVLEPGELMFLPPSWWHSTKNETAAVSTAVRLVNRTNAASAWWDFQRSRLIDWLSAPYFRHG